MESIFLLLGGNLGHREGNLAQARQLIQKLVGNVEQASGIYETQAWGIPDQPDYLNQALKVVTNLSPLQLLQTILDIERQIGRIRTDKWGSRLIDIDILFYGNEVINTSELQIPHPELHKRNFALVPLLEITHHFIHPLFNESLESLYLKNTDRLDVSLLGSRA